MANTSEDRFRKLEIIQASFNHESEVLWNRFVGFATLHGGLLVLATAASRRGWIVVLGLVLAFLWLVIQGLSALYFDAWKNLFHAERLRLGDLPLPGDGKRRRSFPTTMLAVIVPAVVFGLWIAVHFAEFR